MLPDDSLTVLDNGRVLIGGSPLTVLRFARPVDLAEVRAPAVVDRLVDSGMAHPDPAAGPFTADDVTVVVPVFGDVRALSSTLAALARLPVPVARIIVVDDASPEPDAIAATVALAGRRSTRLIRRSVNGGPAAARNTGTAEVTTPLVAYLDAGCVPEPDWLAPLLAHFADPKVALVAPRVRADATRWSDDGDDTVRAPRRRHDGTGVRAHEGLAGPGDHRTTRPSVDGAGALIGEVTTWLRRHVRGAIARYESRRSSLDLGDRPARVAPRTRVAYVPAACIVARTDAVRRAGGFGEALRVGEDVDLVWRLARDHRLRYVPAAGATHDVRTAPGAWSARRFAYGTSAGPLARRHPRGPVPVQVSGWSAAAWAAVALGRPVVGVGIAATSTGLLVRKLANLDRPVPLALRLAGVGNLAAGGLLANAVRRAWWPLAVPAAVFGPKPVRRAVAAAFLVPPLLAWRPASGLDPLTWLVLCTADDLAYGAGVWVGSVRARTLAPLLPDCTAGRVERSPSRD